MSLGLHGKDLTTAMGEVVSNVAEISKSMSSQSLSAHSGNLPLPKTLGYAWGTSPTLSQNVLLLDVTGRSLLLPMLFMTSPLVSIEKLI